MKNYLVLLFSFVFIVPLFGQDGNPDFMTSIGKMYVVVAVIVSMFIGIVLFLINLERKAKDLEKRIEDL